MNYTFNASSWMKDDCNWLRSKSLSEICILGSHDAHMNERKVKFDAFSTLDNTLTQTVNVYQQLLLGVRYFDLRPAVLSDTGDTVHTHHSGNAPVVGLVGGCGRTMNSIVNDINKFTTTNPSEIIILNISHVAGFSDIIGSYRERELVHNDWVKISKCLMKINNLATKSKIGANPIKIPLEKFWEIGASVIINMESSMPTSLLNDSFFKFAIYNEYSNTNSFWDMRTGQYKELNQQRKENDYFLLSWTLTQSTGNIRNGANVANGHLADVLRHVDKEIFPNIVHIDNVLNDTPCCVCAKINYIIHNPTQKKTLPPMLNMTIESYSGKWNNFYCTLAPFEINKEPFLFATTNKTSDGKRWFVSKLDNLDGVNREVVNGMWQKYFGTAVPFYNGETSYLFAQSNTDKKWFISKLDGTNAVGAEIMQGNWGRYFQSAVSFCYNGEYYMFAQSRTDKKWFVSRLHPNVDPGIEIINGNWGNFYETLVVFYIDKVPYLFAQTNSSNNKWFISKLSPNKNDIEEELAHGKWGNFYGSATAFYVYDTPFLYAQTKTSGKKWFISELSSNGASFSNEIISGNWENYYDKCCAYNYKGIPYIFAQSSNNKCFVAPLISCL